MYLKCKWNEESRCEVNFIWISKRKCSFNLKTFRLIEMTLNICIYKMWTCCRDDSLLYRRKVTCRTILDDATNICISMENFSLAMETAWCRLSEANFGVKRLRQTHHKSFNYSWTKTHILMLGKNVWNDGINE